MATPEHDTVTEILATAKNIAVVGLSSNRYRSSFGVSETLQESGYRIFPVNPNEKEVLGEKAYARLEDIPEKIDIVDIFRRSEFVSGNCGFRDSHRRARHLDARGSGGRSLRRTRPPRRPLRQQ